MLPLYYLGIMIEANDMDSIERRLLVTAYEDIGSGKYLQQWHGVQRQLMPQNV